MESHIIDIPLNGFSDNTGVHFTRFSHFFSRPFRVRKHTLKSRKIPARILSPKPLHKIYLYYSSLYCSLASYI